jgi:hypothetical protein
MFHGICCILGPILEMISIPTSWALNKNFQLEKMEVIITRSLSLRKVRLLLHSALCAVFSHPENNATQSLHMEENWSRMSEVIISTVDCLDKRRFNKWTGRYFWLDFKYGLKINIWKLRAGEGAKGYIFFFHTDPQNRINCIFSYLKNLHISTMYSHLGL